MLAWPCTKDKFKEIKNLSYCTWQFEKCVSFTLISKNSFHRGSSNWKKHLEFTEYAQASFLLHVIFEVLWTSRATILHLRLSRVRYVCGLFFFLSGEWWEKSVARLVTKWFWDKSSLDYVMNISNHGNCQTKLKDVGDNKRIYESPRLK